MKQAAKCSILHKISNQMIILVNKSLRRLNMDFFDTCTLQEHDFTFYPSLVLSILPFHSFMILSHRSLTKITTVTAFNSLNMMVTRFLVCFTSVLTLTRRNNVWNTRIAKRITSMIFHTVGLEKIWFWINHAILSTRLNASRHDQVQRRIIFRSMVHENDYNVRILRRFLKEILKRWRHAYVSNSLCPSGSDLAPTSPTYMNHVQ
jgi:hypothetical protein